MSAADSGSTDPEKSTTGMTESSEVKESLNDVKRELQDLMKQYLEAASPREGSDAAAEIELERKKLQNLRDFVAMTGQKTSGETSTTGTSANLPNTVAMALAKDVEKMIERAKRDSEIKVKSELSRIRKEIVTLSEHVTKLSQQVVANKNAPSKADEFGGKGKSPPSESIVDKRTLTEFVQKVETRWLSEMNILKQELHQTILAHNHNADLMKHLKDAMDHIRMQLDERNLLRPDQWIRWMPHVEQFLSQSSQRDRQLQSINPKLDSLLLRVESLESQILSLNPGMQSQFGQSHAANSYLMGGAGARAQHAAWVEDRSVTDSQASQGRVPQQGDARGPGVSSQGVAKDRKQDQAEREKKESQEKEKSLRAAAPVFVPKNSDSANEGSERSGQKPQRKLSANLSGNQGPNAGQGGPQGGVNMTGAGAPPGNPPVPDPKLDGVGAPPGLPPPPGLAQF